MHNDAEIVALEINPVIADAETLQNMAGALQFSKLVHFGAHHLLRQAAKIAKDLELEFLGHLRQFRCAGRIENDLKGSHLIEECWEIAPERKGKKQTGNGRAEDAKGGRGSLGKFAFLR